MKGTLPLILLVCIFTHSFTYAQDNQAQYPLFFKNSYYSISPGYIYYPFSNRQLEPGFSAERIDIPNISARLVLYGREFNKYLSAQITYMRPVWWVSYHNLNGEETRNSVWMNVGGLTLRPSLPISDRFSIHGEFGLGVVTRNGFERMGEVAVTDANYATTLYGLGLRYHVNDKWDIVLQGIYSPENIKNNQPYTSYAGLGFNYRIQQLSDEKLAEIKEAGYVFKKHQLRVGIATNLLGYKVNSFFANDILPIFWGGAVEVSTGVNINYQRNIFHTKKTFAFDIGVNLGHWVTRDVHTPISSVAIFPLMRFFVYRSNRVDCYAFWSAGGPAYISRALIDDIDTGERFTFYDTMGIGFFAGQNKNIIGEINIGHFSNGNIFPENPGIKIPLTFVLGYAF
jgi:hypothetical protein